ncbi:43801_t:CDS:1, partial [Gigaspora margarita]
MQLHRIAEQDNYAADYLTRGTTQELEDLKEQKELLKQQEILEKKKRKSSKKKIIPEKEIKVKVTKKTNPT